MAAIPHTAGGAAALLLAVDLFPDVHLVGRGRPRELPLVRPAADHPFVVAGLAEPAEDAAMALARAAFNAKHPMPAGPPVVIGLPDRVLARGGHYALQAEAPDPEPLSWDGLRVTRLAPEVVRPTSRPFLTVASDLEDLPASPDATYAAAVATIGARHAAHQVETWAASGNTATESRRLRAEARHYRAYADHAEALIPAVSTWAADVDRPPVNEPFPTVPTHVHGWTRPGPIPN